MSGQPKSMRIRYSIRALLVVMVLACVAAYYVTLPDRVARKFVDGINAKQIEQSASFFEGDALPFWNFLADTANEENRTVSASMKPASWSDLIRLRREITVNSQTTGLGTSISAWFYSTPTGITVRTKPD